MFETIVVNPIFNALMLIYSAVPGGDFGVALIIFTIIVRLLMYPLVKNQLHQTKAMRKLQPELAKIKKNAKGNKQIEALQQMELYKRYGIKPLRSILIASACQALSHLFPLLFSISLEKRLFPLSLFSPDPSLRARCPIALHLSHLRRLRRNAAISIYLIRAV